MDRYFLSDKTFHKLSELVKKNMGIKMPISKKSLLESRLQKSVREYGLDSFEEYFELLSGKRASDNEIVQFCNAVATNKTDFFRESAHFDLLNARVLPSLYAGGCRNIRVWSAASSSGEEIYTLAIVMEEFCRDKRDLKYSILGTDISTKVLTKAKRGVYSHDIVQGIPTGLRSRYVKLLSGGEKKEYEVVPSLKSNVRWGRFNLMTNLYNVPGPFEVVFCRNVLIYFDRTNQTSIYNKLVGQIVPEGYLFLGHSESMAGMNSRKRAIAPAVFKMN